MNIFLQALNVVRTSFLLPEQSRSEKLFLAVFYFAIAMVFISLALLQICVIILILVTLFNVLRYRKWHHTALDVPLLLFITARLLSLFFSEEIHRSIIILSKEIPFYFLYYALTQQKHLFSAERIYAAIVFFLFIAAATAIYGTALVFLGIRQRAESFTSGYYTFGTLLTIAIAITFLWGKSFFAESRAIWYFLLALLTTGLLFTLNRVHFGITFLTFLIIGSWRERKAVGVVLLLFLILILGFPSLQQRMYETLHFRQHMSDRDLLWKGALAIATIHPIFGYGPATFTTIFPWKEKLGDPQVGNWHNDYIQTYIESGIVGLFSLLLLLGLYFAQSVRVLFRSKLSQEINELHGAVVSAIGVAFLAAMTGNVLYDPLVRIVLMQFLALSNILMTVAEVPQSSRRT